MKLFQFLLIFLLLLAFVPPFRRFLFYVLVGRKLIREQKKAQQRAQASAKRGGINVDFVPPNSNEPNIRGGEYVDYEEIK